MTLQLQKHFTILALMFVLVWYGASPSHFAQSQDRKSKEPKNQTDAVLKLETELVQVDAVVTNKEGKLVQDLKREDFELLEDGKPQVISYFSMGTATRPARVPNIEPHVKTKETSLKPTTATLDFGRYLVLAVDDLHLAPGNLMQAKQALLRFVDQQIGTNDQIALITTSGRLGLYQQFTSEREVLRRAINRLSVQERSATNNFDIPRITPYQAELIEMGDREALELAVQELMRRFQIQRDMAVSDARAKARMINAQNVSVTVNTLSTLENIIRSLQPLTGRKVIALLSDGFLLGGFSESRHFDVRRITDAATKAGVVIYSIDARGLVATPATMDASQPNNDPIELTGSRSRIENSSIEAQRDGLNALARDTGGIPIFNNNDLNLGLQRVLDDTEIYYLLAFEPKTSYRDGRFRKLEIRIPGRPELKVRSRKGYFAPDEKAAEKAEKARLAEKEKEKPPEKVAKEAQTAKQAQIREGMGALFPLSGIPLQMTASFINTLEDGSTIEIAAHFDASALKFDEANGRHHAILEVIAMVFDDNGKVSENFGERVELNFKPASLEKVRKTGIAYSKYVKLKPGFYHVRMVVREDGTPQLGSASSWVEVPDLSKKQLTLSSIFFIPDGDQPNLVGSAQKTNDNIDDNVESQLPARIYRRFKRDSAFQFMVFAYNAKTDAKGVPDLAVQSQIYSGSKILIATPLKSFSDQNENALKANAARIGIPYLARLSLEAFEPGNYELRTVVIDRNAKASAKQSIKFTVE